MTTILIGGDLCPIGKNKALFESGNSSAIFNDLLPLFKQADLSVVNLECPLTDTPAPIKKTGPVLGSSSAAINGITNADIDVLGLANNHILDHGEQGILNTIRVARDNGLCTVGAGQNIAEARKILSVKAGNLNVGVIAMAEQEWSIAESNRAGANPLDIIGFARQMRKERSRYDYLVVLLHGGYEHYPYPTPNQQKTARFMIEEGANAVIFQHSHVAGCLEEYNGGHIIYGQGNLIFDKPRYSEAWFNGFLINLSILDKHKATIQLIPYKQSSEGVGVQKMNPAEEKAFLGQIHARSKQIEQEGFVTEEWERFCKGKKYKYYSHLQGHNRLLRGLNRVFRFSDWIYRGHRKRVLQNILRCESHKEAIDTIIKLK